MRFITPVQFDDEVVIPYYDEKLEKLQEEVKYLKEEIEKLKSGKLFWI